MSDTRTTPALNDPTRAFAPPLLNFRLPMCAHTGPHGVSSEVFWVQFRHDGRNEGCAFISACALVRLCLGAGQPKR
jgi:hypothetical protein